jgi:hypothetical protein
MTHLTSVNCFAKQIKNVKSFLVTGLFIMHFNFFLLFTTIPFHSVSAEVLPNHHCGIGPVSKVLSYAVSSTCGREKCKSTHINIIIPQFQ